MTSSGTYNFTLSNGEAALAALERATVAPTSVSARHMQTCRREINLLFSEWSNKQVNLWKVVQATQVLTAGTATYPIPAQTIMILDAWISTTQGGSTTDRYITPISRTEFASFANKAAPGPPTVYWFDRLISGTLTTWPVADAAAVYTLNYYRVDQIQDANLAGGETPDVPYRWLDALVAGLAHRLARVYATPFDRGVVEALRKADAKEAWDIAATQDVENVPFCILPGMASYYVK